jgi:hypothetical protein
MGSRDVGFQRADDSECTGACAGRAGIAVYAVRARRGWFIRVTGLGWKGLEKSLGCLVRAVCMCMYCTRCDVDVGRW